MRSGFARVSAEYGPGGTSQPGSGQGVTFGPPNVNLLLRRHRTGVRGERLSKVRALILSRGSRLPTGGGGSDGVRGAQLPGAVECGIERLSGSTNIKYQRGEFKLLHLDREIRARYRAGLVDPGVDSRRVLVQTEGSE